MYIPVALSGALYFLAAEWLAGVAIPHLIDSAHTVPDLVSPGSVEAICAIYIYTLYVRAYVREHPLVLTQMADNSALHAWLLLLIVVLRAPFNMTG